MSLEKVLYTAHATVTGGRQGNARGATGLELELSLPKEMGGAGGAGTNPEELFAAGYAACFMGALKLVAGREKIAIPADTSIESEVGIGPQGGGFGIQAALRVPMDHPGGGPAPARGGTLAPQQPTAGAGAVAGAGSRGAVLAGQGLAGAERLPATRAGSAAGGRLRFFAAQHRAAG